jgi:hypothetical protein
MMWPKIIVEARSTTSFRNETRRFSQRKLGITGGTDAALGDFPHMVMIRIIFWDGSTEDRCAGTLFAYNLVVTAGKLTFL